MPDRPYTLLSCGYHRTLTKEGTTAEVVPSDSVCCYASAGNGTPVLLWQR